MSEKIMNLIWGTFSLRYLKDDKMEPLGRLSKCELGRAQGKLKSAVCKGKSAETGRPRSSAEEKEAIKQT